jgi:hypothetical protein
MDRPAGNPQGDLMKKTALLAPLALILALAAGTSQPAASVASFQDLASASLVVSSPMAVMLQDEAQERATLGVEDVSWDRDFCQWCLTDCAEVTCCSYVGEPCSWQGSGCSCQFCGGQFDCFQ